MITEISDLILRLTDPCINDLEIIGWASPIISFGNPETSKIATLGLNPSNKEFVDNNDNELNSNNRRFQTLASLKLLKWDYISDEQCKMLMDQCYDYFVRNPYDSWFKRLDYLISGTSMSYYFPSREACHLDLVPYATFKKWGNLTTGQKSILLEKYGDVLGLVLKSSTIKILILNGKTVIDNLQKISDVEFRVNYQPTWDLLRENTSNVKGNSYQGYLTKVGGIDLEKKILILGFNHNIQSSFGVTSVVQQEIRNWISEKTKEYL